jgi:hypothetical protein
MHAVGAPDDIAAIVVGVIEFASAPGSQEPSLDLVSHELCRSNHC